MTSFERRLCEELDDPSSYAELKTIISKVNAENPACDTLLKGRYQVLFLENLLPWQKPIGQFFQSVIAICGVKPKTVSSTASETIEESFMCEEEEEEDGNPLPVVFDSLITADSCSSSIPVIRKLREKFFLYPLSQIVGRKILSLCNFISDEYRIPYPVIAMCHGRNRKAVCIQGTMKNDKFVRVVVNTQGLVTKHEQLPKLSYVKLNHLSGFVPSCTSIETSVYARYDVLGYENSSELLPCKDMNVVMECFWSNPSAILEPVSSDCTCYAKIKAVSGDGASGASEKFKEIELAMALFESLETGVMNWPHFCKGENVLQTVEVFMKAETGPLKKRQKLLPAMCDLESFDSSVRDSRNNLDFTDRLWLILKDCSSVEQLKQALLFVFEELSETVDQPFVHQRNKSTIASSINSLKERNVVWPVLTSHLACEMLLEIGIEKLRRDYVTLFVGLELAPSDSLKYFLQPDLLSPEAIQCLQKLHSILELTIIGLKCLRLSKQLLGEFIRNVLKHYTSVPNIDLGHIFKFQVPSTKALLDQMRPTVWEISLLSSDKDFKKQTVLHYSTTPTSEHVYAPKDYHTKLMLKNASYVFMSGTFIEDSFFVS